MSYQDSDSCESVPVLEDLFMQKLGHPSRARLVAQAESSESL